MRAVPRSESDFDPGAKYHIPANTSYTRYFLAHILQFQFHRALCELAGVEGPLHRCSIFGSREAGERLNTMLEMGASRPWPDALEAITGQWEMDATAILDYFAPLQVWLDEQNAGPIVRVVGERFQRKPQPSPRVVRPEALGLARLRGGSIQACIRLDEQRRQTGCIGGPKGEVILARAR